MDKKIIISAAIIAVIAIGIASLSLNGMVTNKSQGKVIIGSVMPLSGEVSFISPPLINSMEMAIEEINSKGGVGGKELVVIFEDGKCTGVDGLTATQKLVNVDGVKVIIGGACSGETLGAAPFAEENKIIMISPGSGSPEITHSGDYIFRTYPSDSDSGEKIANAAKEMGYDEIAIIYDSSDYAHDLANTFNSKYKDLGGRTVSKEMYRIGSKDFRTQVTKTINSNPDAIYLISTTPGEVKVLLRLLTEIGYDGQLFGTELYAGEEILNEFSDELEGLIFAEPDFDPERPQTKKFLDKYNERYGEFTAFTNLYLASYYDSVYIMKEAIEECGETDTDCIRDHLYSIRNRQGAAGKLTIDENGDPDLEFRLKIIRDGEAFVYSPN